MRGWGGIKLLKGEKKNWGWNGGVFYRCTLKYIIAFYSEKKFA